jgi:hypothetical protein
MKLSNLVMVNAVVCIASGIAFSLYAPLMMAFFAVPDALDSPLSYWQVAAFARMFGVAQLGLGLLLLAVRGSLDSISQVSRQGIISALMLANLLGVIVAITQQSAVWQTPAGWITVAIFAAFSIAYIFFLVKNQKTSQNPG